MKKILLCLALLVGWQSAQAGPIDWIKNHKRFLLMEGAAVAGASIDAWGLHHCRVPGVERCTAHYGEAWASFGVATGMTTVVLPAIAEGCWNDEGGKFCYIFAYGGSTVQAAWGLHEYSLGNRPNDKPDLSTVVILH